MIDKKDPRVVNLRCAYRLTPQAAVLLVLLSDGKPHAKEDLCVELLGTATPSRIRTLQVHCHALRVRLEDARLDSIPTFGYRLSGADKVRAIMAGEVQ